MAKSIFSAPQFKTEEGALAYVEAHLWPNGPVCHHCGNCDPARIRKMEGKTTRMGLYKCNECRKPFTVRMGTIFESSHLALHLWLQVIHLFCASKKGISTRQIQRMLDCSMKTAWFLGHRIREAMKDDGTTPIGGNGMTIEADETFWGQQDYQFVNGKGWQRRDGWGDKMKILSLVERGGRARSIHIDNLGMEEVTRALETADRNSHLNTDQARHYRWIGEEFLTHGSVDHSRREYGRGTVHSNTVEGFFSIFKRGMVGVYQHCSEGHLHRYLSEFDFRYSFREKLGFNDAMRTEVALKGAIGKRLTYGRVGSQAAS